MTANTNNVTLKSVKGSSLTHAEMDANFQELKEVIEDFQEFSSNVTGEASSISVADSGGYFAGDNVESVLQEVGSSLGDVASILDAINGEVI